MNTRPYVTFSWDGSVYKLGPPSVQIPGWEFLPTNRLTITSHCVLAESSGEYTYRYRWSNHDTSKQKLQTIRLIDVDTNATTFEPPTWLVGNSIPLPGITWDLFGWHKKYFIRPGATSDEFGLISSKPPAIIDYYVQGYQPQGVNWDEGEPEVTLEQVRHNILNNSFHGVTVGPKVSPSPFNDYDFLDTLETYINRSRSLGWINDSIIAAKYLNFISQAQVKIGQGDTMGAKSFLHIAIQEVVADSGTALTNEAYILIYGNLKYLLNQLSE